MEFQDKLIVITGGAGGIARETARLLLAGGAELLLIDPNAAALEAGAAELASGERVHIAVSALESPEACRAVLAGIDRPVYGLVHLAGVFRADALDPAHRPLWDATIAANLTDAFDMAAAIRPRLDPDAACRMVFASSLAFRRGSFDHIAYSAAKGGIAGLVRALARGSGAQCSGQRRRARHHPDRHARAHAGCARAARASAGRDYAQALRRGARGRHGDPLPAERRFELHYRPADQRRRRRGVFMSWPVHVVILAALAGCSAPIQPEGGGGGGDDALMAPAFARAELSGDEVVSAEEWTADSMVLFDQLDRDHDQEIDAIELRESFEILDLDRDAAIEREEAGELVARGDADGDGRLSATEFEQLKWERLSADLNRDGRISREEFSFTRNQLFLASDRNRDRRLDHREIDPVRFTAFRF